MPEMPLRVAVVKTLPDVPAGQPRLRGMARSRTVGDLVNH